MIIEQRKGNGVVIETSAIDGAGRVEYASTEKRLLTLFPLCCSWNLFFLFPMNLIHVQGYSTTGTGAAALPLILLMFFLSRWLGSHG
jgi:hypothetical protein